MSAIFQTIELKFYMIAHWVKRIKSKVKAVTQRKQYLMQRCRISKHSTAHISDISQPFELIFRVTLQALFAMFRQQKI